MISESEIDQLAQAVLRCRGFSWEDATEGMRREARISTHAVIQEQRAMGYTLTKCEGADPNDTQWTKEQLRKLAEAGEIPAKSVKIPKLGPRRINEGEKPVR